MSWRPATRRSPRSWSGLYRARRPGRCSPACCRPSRAPRPTPSAPSRCCSRRRRCSRPSWPTQRGPASCCGWPARARRENVAVVERSPARWPRTASSTPPSPRCARRSRGARPRPSGPRLPLSLLLAELEAARGNHRAAVAELRGALELDARGGRRTAGEALELWRSAPRPRTPLAGAARRDLRAGRPRARGAGDIAGARRLIAELLAARSPRRRARSGCMPSSPRPTATSRRRSTRPTTSCSSSEGEAQVAAAHRLVELAARAGPDARRDGRRSSSSSRRTRARPALVDLLAPLYEQAGERGKLAALLYDRATAPRTRTSASSCCAARAPSRSRRRTLAGRHGAQRGAGHPPGDEESALLLVRRLRPRPARSRKRPTLSSRSSPRTRARPRPALAALHAAPGAHRRPRGRRQGGAGRAGPRARRRQEERRDHGRARRPRRGRGRPRPRAQGAAPHHRQQRRRARSPSPDAFLRQARIAERRGERERAIMFARRAAQEAPKGDAVQVEARAFLEAQDAAPSRPPPVPKARK